MSKYIFLSGKAKWAKLDKPDAKYGYYGINLYMDEESEGVFKESGLTLRTKEDEEGKFVTFRRDPEKLFEDMEEKPRKLIFDPETKEYLPLQEAIGNGSLVTVKVEVYETKKYGMGHRLEAVAVDNLVPYNDDTEDMPF